MNKILVLAGMAGALSACNATIIVTPNTPTVSSVALASRYVRNDNVNEYYICGNKDEVVSVSVNYSGSFTSFSVKLIGELNPNQGALQYGPFTFDAVGEGDTSTNVTRRLSIKTTDIKPNAAGSVSTQAVIVTPTPIPVPPSNETGIGGIYAEVTFSNSAGTAVKKSSGVIRLLTASSSRCQ